MDFVQGPRIDLSTQSHIIQCVCLAGLGSGVSSVRLIPFLCSQCEACVHMYQRVLWTMSIGLNSHVVTACMADLVWGAVLAVCVLSDSLIAR